MNFSWSASKHRPFTLIVWRLIVMVWWTPLWNQSPSHLGGKLQRSVSKNTKNRQWLSFIIFYITNCPCIYNQFPKFSLKPKLFSRFSSSFRRILPKRLSNPKLVHNPNTLFLDSCFVHFKVYIKKDKNGA